MWLAAVSVPLVVMVTRRYGLRVAALCRRALARLLRLLRGRVCVRSTHAFVFSRCTHGQVDSVLETFDLYADSHPTLCISPQTAQALDAVLMRLRPLRVLELGMHCGYTSVRMLRLMPPAGRLITVEQDPLTADLGEEIILVSGFKHNQVLTSSSEEAIPTVRQFLQSDGGSVEDLDLVLMDHDPIQYRADLQFLMREELLNPSGCTILLIKRNQQTASLREAVEYVRERPQWFCIKSDLHFMTEIFYQCRSPTVDM